ncbi:antigen 5 like allergen Cul n 1-like [Bradysia coprophila]|uniref:antigen 5 like allergen Cul n 1-like n=1 Tax=Bradysia coprophila TaxID=38358 RepID=UPI00187DC7EF|nr:antigen 5 like allergen Cul n 1-like [Bradysia coprophila]
MITKLFIILALITFSQTTDYCNKQLCQRIVGGKLLQHIGCKNNGNFGPKCPKDRSIEPMTAERISLLLQSHNQLRSDIATGKIQRYDQADQMIEMEWDHELARLAEMNVKTCIFAHDQCRSTDQYPLPGQNIHITWFKNQDYEDVDFNLVESTKSWFREHELCDMSFIHSYRRSDKKIGHFTQIVKAAADRVGCALAKYDDGKQKNMLLTCNYSVGDILDEPIYTTGKPCSKCLSGCSQLYSGLCNSNEKTYWVNGNGNKY